MRFSSRHVHRPARPSRGTAVTHCRQRQPVSQLDHGVHQSLPSSTPPSVGWCTSSRCLSGHGIIAPPTDHGWSLHNEKTGNLRHGWTRQMVGCADRGRSCSHPSRKLGCRYLRFNANQRVRHRQGRVEAAGWDGLMHSTGGVPCIGVEVRSVLECAYYHGRWAIWNGQRDKLCCNQARQCRRQRQRRQRRQRWWDGTRSKHHGAHQGGGASGVGKNRVPLVPRGRYRAGGVVAGPGRRYWGHRQQGGKTSAAWSLDKLPLWLQGSAALRTLTLVRVPMASLSPF